MSDAPARQETSPTSSGPRPRRGPVSARERIALVVATIAVTALAGWQVLEDDGLSSSGVIGWLLHPVELSPEAALMRIDGDLRAVSASDSRHIIVVGDRGLIARSTDGGLTWTQEWISGSGAAPASPEPQSPTQAPPSSKAAPRDAAAPPDGKGAAPARPPRGKPKALLDRLVPPAMAAEEAQQGPSRTDPGSAASASVGAGDELFSVNVGSEVLAMTATGWLLRRGDDGKWRPQSFVGSARNSYVERWHGGLPRGFLLPDKRHGWWATGSGEVVPRTDGRLGTPVKLSAYPLAGVWFLPDGRRGWAVGDKGVVMASADGGARWTARTRLDEPRGRPLRAPAPWYYPAILALGYLAVRRRPPVTTGAEPGVSVADVMVSDKPLMPGEPDLLEFNVVARALSRFLRNENTRPPLTIGITGDWGTGKSSLMNLLRADLESFGFHPVWFNAWHHQGQGHLLASLLQSIRLQSVPSLSPEGVAFRTKLLVRRAMRSRRRLFVLMALLSLLVCLKIVYGIGFVEILVMVKAAAQDHQKPDTAGALSGVTWAVFLAVTARSLWEWLRAFGISPGKLLARESQAASPRDLDAQTSFLDRFAREYRDITRALGVRTLVLFIDDLDRCQPEHVVQVLEAVNYLVSSGECFVVLGMARDRVEPCVALRFKDVADELTDREGPVDEAERRRRRDQYAREYLDKLINVEVPVPHLTADVAVRLFPHEAVPVAVKPRLLHDRQRLEPLLLQGAGTLLVMAMGIGLGVAIAVVPAHMRPPPAEKQAAPVEPPAGGAPPTSTTAGPPPAVSPGLPHRELIWLIAPFALVAIAAGLLWQFLTTRSESLVVKDTGPFARALEIWEPVVFRAVKTPRGLKRFLNRVRYLAMRARPGSEVVSRWERWFHPPAPPTPERPHIPEPALVALAAIQALDPEGLPQVGVRPAPHVDAEVQALVDSAVQLHQSVFGEGRETLAHHRAQFLERVSGIRVN
jgi:hypothetical protein